MKTLLVLTLLSSVQLNDPFEQWLCDQARKGLLDCTYGSGRCTIIKNLCKPEKAKPEERRT